MDILKEFYPVGYGHGEQEEEGREEDEEADDDRDFQGEEEEEEEENDDDDELEEQFQQSHQNRSDANHKSSIKFTSHRALRRKIMPSSPSSSSSSSSSSQVSDSLETESNSSSLSWKYSETMLTPKFPDVVHPISLENQFIPTDLKYSQSLFELDSIATSHSNLTDVEGEDEFHDTQSERTLLAKTLFLNQSSSIPSLDSMDNRNHIQLDDDDGFSSTDSEAEIEYFDTTATSDYHQGQQIFKTKRKSVIHNNNSSDRSNYIPFRNRRKKRCIKFLDNLQERSISNSTAQLFFKSENHETRCDSVSVAPSQRKENPFEGVRKEERDGKLDEIDIDVEEENKSSNNSSHSYTTDITPDDISYRISNIQSSNQQISNKGEITLIATHVDSSAINWEEEAIYFSTCGYVLQTSLYNPLHERKAVRSFVEKEVTLLSSNGRNNLIVAASKDGYLKTLHERSTWIKAHDSNPTHLYISNNGKRVISVCMNHIRIWDEQLNAVKFNNHWILSSNLLIKINCISTDNESNIIIAGLQNGSIIIWNSMNGKLNKIFKNVHRTSIIRICIIGLTAVSVADDGSVCVIFIEDEKWMSIENSNHNHKKLQFFENFSHDGSIEISNNGAFIAFVDQHHVITIVDIDNAICVASIDLKLSNLNVLCVESLSDDGRSFVWRDNGNTLRVWQET